MKDEQLLVPAASAARKLGVSRWTLKRLIKAKEIRAVKVGHRRFIPQSEIETLVNGEPVQITKPAKADPLSEHGASGSKVLQGGDSTSIAHLLADTEELEYLTPGEVKTLNAYEMEEATRARARMAANPCIQFSNIPTHHVWRATDSLAPSLKNWWHMVDTA
jgi:excisionase family DNA binding protein